MILICYDGSTDAKEAIARGARMLRGHRATVLTIWSPFDMAALGLSGLSRKYDHVLDVRFWA